MKILMISYPFPPYGGMSQRNVYFANHLVEKGHTVDVLAVNPSRHFHGYDVDMVKLISPEVRVYRTYAGLIHHLRYRFKNIFSPADSPGKNLLKLIHGVLLKNLVFPLSTLEWLPTGFLYGFRLCFRNRYDVIYSHNNPHITNLIAYLLKKIFRIPWVVYIGDPGFFGAYSRFKRVLRFIEDRCFSNADKIIVNCEATLDGYLKHFPRLGEKRFTIITDGFDEGRYKEISPERSDKFRMVYTGVFYDTSREPFELFKSLRDSKRDDIELVVAGDVSERYKEFVRNNGLDGVVNFLGHQPHNRVISLQKGAAVLLLIGWSGGYQVPGKLFEYFAAKRPILVIRYDKGDVAAVFTERYSRGVIVDNKADKISVAIQNLYNLWKQDKLGSSFKLEQTKEFTWKSLSRELEEVFRVVVQDEVNI